MSSPLSDKRSLLDLRIDFSKACATLLLEANSGAFGPGISLVFDEGRIITPRKVAAPGRVGHVVAEDRLHMKGSLHHIGLAQDFNLYVDKKYVDSDHPVWHLMGERWKAMDPLAAWGGDFKARDFNHFSFRYGGRA